MALTLTSLNQVANAAGVSIIFVKALVGLSQPARTALRLQLNATKETLQGELSTLAFSARIAERKQNEININR